MQDSGELEFEIYHNGVHFKAPVRGKARFLQERNFLDDLVGRPHQHRSRPVPDRAHDFYELNDAQLEAYSTFRRSL